ncbi:MAG TPA: DapH/DapD/GlmU-related protein, partial [Bacillota bacterium]|nr:DapH/DapD/GlmU-related protein [Bacillota bacterium]
KRAFFFCPNDFLTTTQMALIKEGCLIGTNSALIEGISIGEWSIIGAGAVVTKDIPPHCTAVGVPAKPIKFHQQ